MSLELIQRHSRHSYWTAYLVGGGGGGLCVVWGGGGVGGGVFWGGGGFGGNRMGVYWDLSRKRGLPNCESEENA